MQNEHNAVFALAQRLHELQAEKADAERTLREIKVEISETEQRLSEAMGESMDWIATLVCVFKKRRKGGGTDV